MEFILKKEVSEIVPQSVDFNFDQLKQELQVSLEKYQNLVVTEDATKEAKADRAKLNALKTTIDNKRKEIKRAWNVPYIEFEDKVKELTGMIDKPIKQIDTQVKKYEKIKKEEKETEIKDYFNNKIGELSELVPYSKIKDPKWLNASVKLATVKKDIDTIISRINTDTLAIKALEVECETQMLDQYFRNLSLSDAMAEKKRWEDQLERLHRFEEEKKRKQAQAREEEQKRMQTKVKAETVKYEPIHPEKAQPEPMQHRKEQAEPLQTLDFRVFVTKHQKQLLKEFLVNNSIKYGRVK